MAIDPVGSLQGVTQRLLLTALDTCMERHRVIAQNVANVDTEGYRPLQVGFEAQLKPLQQAVSAGASDAQILQLIDQFHPVITQESDAAMSGSHAQRLDDQMVALADNTLQYQALLGGLARLSTLNTLAITGNIA